MSGRTDGTYALDKQYGFRVVFVGTDVRYGPAVPDLKSRSNRTIIATINDNSSQKQNRTLTYSKSRRAVGTYFQRNSVAVSRSYASIYFDRVLDTISSGKLGG